MYEDSFNDFKNVSSTSILGNNLLMNFSGIATPLLLCGALLVAVIITTITKNLMFFRIAMNACEKLHNNMFECLMNTPLRFFQINPSGKTCNKRSLGIFIVNY